jgi:hypothetical protein
MKKVILLLFVSVNFVNSYSQDIWQPTNTFQYINIDCIGKDYFWGYYCVSGHSQSNYLHVSTNNGVSWSNFGSHPGTTVLDIALYQTIFPVFYTAIRDINNSANNGVYKYETSWGSYGLQGLKVQCLFQKVGILLAGVRDNLNGIYKTSTTQVPNWVRVLPNVDIYCFNYRNNIVVAGGNDINYDGIVLKSTDYGSSWITIGSGLNGYIYGVTITDSGNVFAVSHYGDVYRSLGNLPFEKLNNISSIHPNTTTYSVPIVSNSLGHIFIGDNYDGIYKTTNNGNNWTSYNEGLPTTEIVALHIKPPDYNTILTGCYRNSNSNCIYKRQTIITGVKNINNQIPGNYFINQNYPNPFNPTTNIKFALSRNEFTTIKIYDILGNEITTLVNEKLNAGTYSVDWNANDYPSGVYFYHIQTDGFTDTKRMILIK